MQWRFELELDMADGRNTGVIIPATAGNFIAWTAGGDDFVVGTI